MIADKVNHCNDFRQAIIDVGARQVIPPRSKLQNVIDQDHHLYIERKITARTSNQLKQFRKNATCNEMSESKLLVFIFYVRSCNSEIHCQQNLENFWIDQGDNFYYHSILTGPYFLKREAVEADLQKKRLIIRIGYMIVIPMCSPLKRFLKVVLQIRIRTN